MSVSAKSRAAPDHIEDRAWSVIEALFFEPRCTKAQLRSVRRFLEKLDFADVIEAAQIAAEKFHSGRQRQFRYFCGVCWHKIRGAEHG